MMIYNFRCFISSVREEIVVVINRIMIFLMWRCIFVRIIDWVVFDVIWLGFYVFLWMFCIIFGVLCKLNLDCFFLGLGFMSIDG